MNCWEYNKCPNERKLSCKAFPDRGKDCWKVTGTMCQGKEQGNILTKIELCRECEFYKFYANKF